MRGKHEDQRRGETRGGVSKKERAKRRDESVYMGRNEYEVK